MDTRVAEMLARGLSLLVYAMLAFSYGAPWLRRQGRAEALTALLWVHAFRHVALHLPSTQASGFPISDAGRDEIMYGDLGSMGCALLAIVALRYRWRGSIPLIWVFVVGTTVDLARVIRAGAREHLAGVGSGINFLIVNFFGPLVVVCLVLTVWQLVARRGEPLDVTDPSGSKRRGAS